MGLDISYSWIAGAVLEAGVVEEVVTRYHEKTGKPYETKVKTDVWFFQENPKQTFDPEEVFDDDEAQEELWHEGNDTGFAFLGLCLDLMGSHRNTEEPPYAPAPSSEAQSELLRDAKKRLAKLGYEGPVGHWVVRDESY